MPKNRIIAHCLVCKEKMRVSYQSGELHHFYCDNCHQVYLPKEVKWVYKWIQIGGKENE